MTTTTETTTITAFEIGGTYTARSACNSDCIWEWTVIKRTAKFITIEDDHGKISRVGVRVSDGSETADPMGRYSLSPVIRADRMYER